MNTTPRRHDRKISEDEAMRILDTAEYGTLALHSDNEYPYCVPLNFAKCGKILYMHCATIGRKLDCIKKDPRAMFCVVGKSDVVASKFTAAYASAMVFGKIEICADHDERIAALNLLAEKFSPDYRKEAAQFIAQAAGRTTVLKFEIESISGKGNKIAQ